MKSEENRDPSAKDRIPRAKVLKLRAPRKLKSGEALKELVSKKRVLPACESSSACSRSGR